MGLAAVIREALVGHPVELPQQLARRFPELTAARYRRGGLPARIGGWALGQSSVAAITLWRTIWLAPETAPTADLLLHELRHVHQFQSGPGFPVLYVLESLRRGYHRNRFELDADAYARERLGAVDPDSRPGDAQP
jgi:hypothetical protein